MKGDFTRSTFRPARHYGGVRLQQGRVLLDADWNEQADIQAYRDRTGARDVVGLSGAPLGDAGFALSTEGGNLKIGGGRYYVDGILCENEEDVAFAATPALPGVFTQPDLPGVLLPGDPGRYLAYLDVWERHITVLEDATIREVALGGPDTTTRTRTVWQVKLEQVDPNASRSDFDAPGWAPKNARSTGRLRARARRSTVPNGPPAEFGTAGYRRLENQLYRVEIHEGSGASDGPTFLWSRDNASTATSLVGIREGVLTVSDPGKDEVLGFAGGQWVELSDEGRTLRGEPGVLVGLASVDGGELVVRDWPEDTPLTMDDFGARPTVRRWDSVGSLPVGTGWLDLEDGVQVEFETDQTPPATYNTGDYWLIPARSLNGSVEWPTGAPDAQGNAEPLFETRHGVEHHYRPLALLQLATDGATWTLESERRRLFAPLAAEAGVHVVEAFLLGTEQPLRYKEPVPADQLTQGIRLTCAAKVDQDVVSERHRCLVTLDLPFNDPSTGRMIGFQPIVLASEVQASGRDILWSPSGETRAWLEDELFDSPEGAPVLARLRLTGSTFEMNFLVVPSKDAQINIGFLPNVQSELFSADKERLDLMSEAVNYAIDRDKLKEVLPIGYETQDNQFDPARAEDRIRFLIQFRGLPRIISGLMVVDERFADAGRLVVEMLRGIPDIPVNLDLLIASGTRIEESFLRDARADVTSTDGVRIEDVSSAVDRLISDSDGALPAMVICDQETADILAEGHAGNFLGGALERF